MEIAKVIYLINVFALAFVCNYSLAQSSENQSNCYIERVFLHHDKPYYTTGERVRVSAYLINENNRAVSPKSQVLYIELLLTEDSSQHANIVSSVRIDLHQGRGEGGLLIPPSLSTGVYQLRAYTKYMLNFDHQIYFYKNLLPIVNSFSAASSVNLHDFFPSNGNPLTDILKEHSPQVTVSFQNIQTHYAPREKVAFDIILKDESNSPLTGTFSVTVVDASLYEQGFHWGTSVEAFFTNGYPVTNDCEQEHFQINPEEKSDIQLQLRKNDQPLPLHKVILFLTGKRPRYFEKKTSQEGIIALSSTELKGIDKIYAHSLQGEKEGLSWVLKDDHPEVPIFVPELPNIDREALEKYVQTMRKIREIEVVYEQVADTLKQTSERVPMPIGEPSEVIYPEDYTAFSTLPEVIREIVPGVKINYNKDKYTIGILNHRTKLYAKGDPVIFINNIPVFDVQLAMELDPAKVQRIEIVRPSVAQSALGTLGKNGALSIFMWNHTESEAIYNHLSIDVNNFYSSDSFDRSEQHALRNIPNVPDFRTAVYWHPGLQTDNEGKVSVQFFNSDIVSRFMIKVQGFTDDHKPIAGTYYYETSLTGQ